MKIRSLALPAALVAGLAIPGTAQAAFLSLGFDSLPTAQGWTYSATGTGAGIPQSQVFTATGTSLIQDTRGTGIGESGQNLFQRAVSLTPFQRFNLTMVARVTETEGTSGRARVGFSFGLSTSEGLYQFGISRDGYARVESVGTVQTGSLGPDYDPDVFNTFTLRRGIGSVVLEANGVFLLAFESQYNLGIDRLLLGDGSGPGNARAEIQSYVFQTEGRGGLLPEPASWAMLVGGFGVVGGAMRTRRRTASITA